MNQELRGILTFFLVTSIAMAMLLAFGVRAFFTASQCQVSSVQCRYSQFFLSAKGDPLEP